MSAADDANFDLGDNLWDIGCKAFSRTCHAISLAAAKSDAYPYLSIRDKTKHFVFAIGGVPIRVYRGDFEQDAPERYSVPDDKEINDLQLAFDLYDTPTPSAIFRILVETDTKGLPTAMRLVQVEADGTLLNPWRIGLEGPDNLVRLAPEPVTLPPAEIGDEPEERAREADEAEARDAGDETAKGA